MHTYKHTRTCMCASHVYKRQTLDKKEVVSWCVCQESCTLQSYLYGSVLSLATISVFLRVGFLLKLVLMLAVTTFHLALYSGLQLAHSYYSKWHNGFEGLPHEFMTALLLAIMVTLLHVLDRQIEFTSRTDFLWKAKLKVEQEEVETMRGINKILLENILPAHVAEHFLDKRNSQVQSCSSLPKSGYMR